MPSRSIREWSTSLGNSTPPGVCARRSGATLRCSKRLVPRTEVARRNLVSATEEAYYGLALAAERRVAAEHNVAAAAEFERTIALQVSGGEAAPIDQVRARLQTTVRRDELEQARAAEAVTADSLRVLIGYDFTQPIQNKELLLDVPEPGEFERYTADAIAPTSGLRSLRPSVARRLRTSRRHAPKSPQLTYSVSGSFISDSLRPPNIREHTGVLLRLLASQFRSLTGRTQQPAFGRRSWRAARIGAHRGRALARAKLLLQRAHRPSQRGAPRFQHEHHRCGTDLVASLARYRAGEAQLIEVTDAQNTLIAQRTALYQAIFSITSGAAHVSGNDRAIDRSLRGDNFRPCSHCG